MFHVKESDISHPSPLFLFPRFPFPPSATSCLPSMISIFYIAPHALAHTYYRLPFAIRIDYSPTPPVTPPSSSPFHLFLYFSLSPFGVMVYNTHILQFLYSTIPSHPQQIVNADCTFIAFPFILLFVAAH